MKIKIYDFENVTKKRLIVQFVLIFGLPYIFIFTAGILSELWEQINFYSMQIVVIAVIIAFIQLFIFIKYCRAYVKLRKNTKVL